MVIDHNIVELCRAYAALHCHARLCNHPDYAACLYKSAQALGATAPGTALAYLDTVKRVLEIDPTVTTVSVVLMRASLLAEEAI
jgi:hypothetical protein